METLSRSSSKLEPTPVNWRVILVSFTILTASSSTISMLFPYLPWMVRKFRVNGEFVQEEDVGYYAGFVASAYFFGRFFACYFWGILADKKGRRLTVLVSGSGIAVFTFMFGFTNTRLGLAWAMVTRFLSGASNGVVGASKATVADVSDDTNQALGMTFVEASWGLGLVVGPALGGLLAEPVRQYPGTFSSGGFLETFPYFLPCTVTASLFAIGLVLVFFLLPETLRKRGSSYNVDEVEASVLYVRPVGNDDDGSVSIERTKENNDTFVQDIDTVADESEPKAYVRESNGVWTRFRGLGRRARRASVTAIKDSTWWNILKIKGARMSIATYCVISFSVVGFDELASVWMATKSYRGGLGFSEKEIGISQAVLSVVLVPVQIIFVRKLEKKLGSLMTFYAACTVCVLITASLPALSSIENSAALWTMLLVSLIFLRFCMGVTFIMVSICMNNSVPKYRVGAINGLSVSLTALTRTFSPSVGGSLFAWSIGWGEGHLGFPFGHHLVFYFFSIVYLVALLLSVNLPSSLQKQKKQ
ncbi:uncharacterized protein [Oscarella lobularis]|uniref:uncharacterized protein n=1 Tax=Oscarella lobularis TaxID=121494 RepID=UPI00331365BF